MDKEMNFWDMCVACGHAIGRCAAWAWQVLQHMIRLTWRYWWLALVFIGLAIGAALYYTRTENLTYKMNAVAMINGASVSQFEQAFAPLRSGILLPEEAAITPFVKEYTARQFETYRVIDCMHDGVADFIDFKGKVSATDTLKVQMKDRLCIQFRIKKRHMDQVPQIEQAVLDFLNSNVPMQRSYITYLKDMQEEVDFNHRQALKLDSLTSHYYYHTAAINQPSMSMNNGITFNGDRRIRLFLNEIYDQQEHMRLGDYRIQFATAPIVLENHFSVDPAPVNDRKKCLVLFCLIAWIGTCVLAELIDKRKAIYAWLKR